MLDAQSGLRVGAACSLLAAVAHLLIPDRLLTVAGVCYDRVLAVDFEPRAGAIRRVRLIGIGFLVAAWLAWRLGDRLGEDYS